MDTKQCTKCSLPYPSEEFFRKTQSLHSWCKQCRKEYMVQYRQSHKDDPKFKQDQKNASKRYHDTSEKYRAYRERYRSDPNTKELDKKAKALWYQTNKDASLHRSTVWKQNNPDKCRAAAKRARAKRKANPVTNLADRIRRSIKKALKNTKHKKTSTTFALIGYSAIDAANHLCRYINKPCEDCRRTVVVLDNCHLDHITPISLAETIDDVIRLSQLSNFRLICPTCNLRKKNKIL